MQKNKTINFILASAVLLIMAIPVGIANLYLGYVVGEGPCTLCWNERIGMVIVGVAGILILRYGFKTKYIAMVIFSGAYGMYMTLRHSTFSIYRDVGMGFGGDIFGAHTYTWGILVYWIVLVFIGILLLFIKNKNLDYKEGEIQPLSKYSKFVIYISLFVTLSNAFQALVSSGLPPYSGKGAPERISLNNTWSLSAWRHLKKPFSFVGPNVVEKPYIAYERDINSIKFNPNSKDGAFVELEPELEILNTIKLPFKAQGFFSKGRASSLAYNAKTNSFGISNTYGGVYFTDENFNLTHSAVIDKPNGRNIQLATASTFYDDMFVVMGFNKTMFAIKKEDASKIDPYKEWNSFRQTSGSLTMPWYRDRPVVLTIRSKKSYILSFSKDPNSKFLYMLTVPNDKVKKWFMIKVDSKDRLLSGESIVSSEIKLKDGRNINDYYITAADIKDGNFIAYSKNYNTLLRINLESSKITQAYKMPKIGDISGLAIKDDMLYFLVNDKDEDKIVTLKSPF